MPISVVVNSTSNLAGMPSVIIWTVIQASMQDRCAVFAEVVQLTNQPQVKVKENLAIPDMMNVQKASFAEMFRTPLAVMCQCVPQKIPSQPQVKVKENLASLDMMNVQKAAFAEMFRIPLAVMCQCVQQKKQSHKVNLEYGELQMALKEHGLLMM